MDVSVPVRKMAFICLPSCLIPGEAPYNAKQSIVSGDARRCVGVCHDQTAPSSRRGHQFKTKPKQARQLQAHTAPKVLLPPRRGFFSPQGSFRPKGASLCSARASSPDPGRGFETRVPAAEGRRFLTATLRPHAARHVTDTFLLNSDRRVPDRLCPMPATRSPRRPWPFQRKIARNLAISFSFCRLCAANWALRESMASSSETGLRRRLANSASQRSISRWRSSSSKFSKIKACTKEWPGRDVI